MAVNEIVMSDVKRKDDEEELELTSKTRKETIKPVSAPSPMEETWWVGILDRM